MQDEIDADGPGDGLIIQIVGINEVGYESANDTMTSERALPWLQDTEEDNVWASWNVNYRDVIVVDEHNMLVSVFNLTENDLGDEDTYEALKQQLVDAAEQ